MFGTARFLTGLYALRRQLGRSRPVEDAELLGLASELRAALGCGVVVSIHESGAMALPATFGWLRPCILLPASWRGWTLEERRVVLAHELAHIRRGDFLARLIARACLTIHFYHPVAYWLAARLRLFQEFAADASAIPLSGGRATYLTTLARMALRHDDLRADWVGRPQLMFGGSFLRRMDMLCNQKRLGESPASNHWGPRILTVGLLVAVALLATAIRTPLAPADDREPPAGRAIVNDPARPALAPFDLTYVPADAVGIVAIRPSAIFAQEEMQPLMTVMRAELAPYLAKAAEAGILPESIDQVIYVQLRTDLESIMKDPGAILKTGFLVVRIKDKLDAATAVRAFTGESKAGSHSGRSYTVLEGNNKDRFAIYQADERTVILAMEGTLHRIMNSPLKGEVKHGWAEAWQDVNRSHFALAFDAAYARNLFSPLLVSGNMLDLVMFTAPVAPIWDGARSISLGMSLVGDQIEIRSVNTGTSSEAAETTQQTVQAILTLARNASGSLKRQFRTAAFTNKGGAEMLLYVKLIDLWAGKILQSMHVERAGNSVRFSAKIDLDALLILSGAAVH